MSCVTGVARALMPPVLSANTAVSRLTYSVLARGPGGTVRHSYTIRIAAYVPNPQPAAPPPAAGWQESLNWSGYVVPSSGLVTDVSGSWTVPTVNCSATPDAGVSIWVGVGGTSSESLLQTGIRETCRGGVASYAGWWEEYPNKPNREADFFPFPVSPGDSITASVYQSSATAWVTRLDDQTTGSSGWMVTGDAWGVGRDGGGTFTAQGGTAGLTFAGGHTAEWIVEDAITVDSSIVPFADYGNVSFTNLHASPASWSLSPAEGWEIIQNGTVLSAPSQPGSDGDSFSVSYADAPSPAPDSP